ncbi:MAG: SDR family oxidoreductase [Saprospiraceae bacterium]|nr:SDR family oxidoreductase [Saprospiraceae bacterium]
MSHKGNVVITGASSGIGYAATNKFIEEGFRVFASVRKQDDVVMLKQRFGEHCHPLQFDVTDHKAIYRSASQVEEILGHDGIDLLINNAGVAVNGPTEFIDIEEYRYQFEVNFFGLIETTKAFLPLLGADVERQFVPGKIFNISSVAGQLVYPFMGPYSASKHALEGFSHALRRELMVYGIDVIIIAPGSIKTPIWDKVEDTREAVRNSVYTDVIDRFRNGLINEANQGLEVSDFAKELFEIFQKRSPRARYAILNNKFTKWTIPRYFLSHRRLDLLIKRMLRMG